MNYEEFNVLEPSQKTMDRIENILTYQPMTLDEIRSKLQIETKDVIVCLFEMEATHVIKKKFKDNNIIAYYGLTNSYPINPRIVQEIIE